MEKNLNEKKNILNFSRDRIKEFDKWKKNNSCQYKLRILHTFIKKIYLYFKVTQINCYQNRSFHFIFVHYISMINICRINIYKWPSHIISNESQNTSKRFIKISLFNNCQENNLSHTFSPSLLRNLGCHLLSFLGISMHSLYLLLFTLLYFSFFYFLEKICIKDFQWQKSNSDKINSH